MENEDTEFSSLVKAEATYYEAPAELRSRIGAALAQAQEQKAAPKRRSAWFDWTLPLPAVGGAQWWRMGGAFAAGVVLASVCMFGLGVIGQQHRLSDQVVENHLRSLMVTHLSDVISTDQHTVKPWFDGKLNYSPPIHDLAAQGYPLAGGRLDYIDGQPVAALVYRHRLHAINVFVWPVRDKSIFVSTLSSKQGFNYESWQAGGMEFWAVSDVQATDLHAFTQLLRHNES